MKPYNEGEMEGRRGRSNANRINADTGTSRRSTGTGATRTPRNGDINIDRYPSRRQHQQTQATTIQQRNVSNIITRTQDAYASSFVGGTNQRVVVPAPATAGDNNFVQDDDTYASLTSSQDQARWNDMVLPDSSIPAGATSHLGYDDDYYYNKKKHDKIEGEAKAEEQAVWEGMLVDPDTAVSSTTVTDDNSGNPNGNNNKKKEANGQNQGGEQAVETQQNDSRSDNAMAAGAATTASPSPATPTAGAFAVSADETVQRGGEDDTFTQASEAETNLQHDEENTVSAPNLNDEDGSPVVVQAHLVAYDESQEQRIQQLEAIIRQQQQLQQPMAPLVHAEIASAAPEVMQDNNDDEMPPPSPPVSEQEQQTERSNKQGAMRSWIVKNRRNRYIALGLVAVVVVAAVVAVAIPLSNSSSGSSSSSNKGVVSNNNSSSTGPPSSTSTPSSEEPSVAPTTDTGSPVATNRPTVAPTETVSPPPTVAVTTQSPTRLPTRRPTSPPTTALPTTGSPSPPPPPPTPIALLPDGPWKPLGQELGGKAEEDRFGSSVSLSRDARVLAVGADHVSSGRPGYVSIFELDDSTGSWVAQGQELVGEANGDRFGWSVALNGDGTILAVGAIWNNGGGSDAGHVRLFQHDTRTNQWVQLGSDIDGEKALDYFGCSVSLSKAGDILAVGALYGSDNGSVRTFRYDGDTDSWDQLGQTLVGQAKDDEFGSSVSMSSSGEILAVGAWSIDVGGNSAGYVSMHQYNSASSEWDPMGSPIIGQVVHGRFGSSVSLDDSGMVVAVGASGFDERVLVYAYNDSTSAWIQRGQTLESQQAGSNFGESVSLNGNGSVLAVGSEHHANGLEDSGQVIIFQYNTITMEWDTVGEPLNGMAAGDNFGDSVSLSEDGTVVAVGAYGRDFNGITNSGSASVYTLN